ncbi:activating signal cointegrator 1-like [Thamnophis elegans]|uniref:activating signal cointegrator 1-like n=1 Tax=Thamnophis elegans TaxID=35005 RepID=UPI00137889CF|nr:activating signal cointegrator 1-like [Thamnophis elegans]
MKASLSEAEMMAAAALVSWCTGQLRGTFGLDVSEEIIQYILSIDDEEEIREYVADLIQGRDGQKKCFIDELVAKWKQSRSTTLDPLPLNQKKDDILDTPRPGDQTKRGRHKGRNKQETPIYVETCQLVEKAKTPLDLAKAQEFPRGNSSCSTKKKAKYVNLYTKEGQDKLAVMLPGRHSCECLAQKHKLINNCLTCGRIVCEQEGSGPCLFCGTLVCTKEEQDVLQRDSNKSQKLLKKLLGGVENSGKADVNDKDLLQLRETRLKSGLEMAVKHKDKLLEYDKNSVRRTQVIDDESDYFATDSNQWLSKQERQVLEKRAKELYELRHASRLSKKITIDFAGRQIREENDNMADYHSKLDETVEAISLGSLVKAKQTPDRKLEDLGVLVNPHILQAAPVWVDQAGLLPHRKMDISVQSRNLTDSERSRLRIQDREIQEISDGGWCLSLHQPWASLLVKGIKRVEGRIWYTSHRGRLWIAATAKRPTPQEISELEATYRVLLQEDLEFPEDYPSGCLLGCVDLIDCLSQEQFQEQYPQLSQESASPFVFICSNPQEMVIKFPIKGKHKLWKLDSKIHQGAKKGLMKQKIAA